MGTILFFLLFYMIKTFHNKTLKKKMSKASGARLHGLCPGLWFDLFVPFALL